MFVEKKKVVSKNEEKTSHFKIYFHIAQIEDFFLKR